MKKIRLALIAGGISSERAVSLSSGDQVYAALDKDRYEILRYDPKTDLRKLVMDADGIDAALIILHGPYGEDGTVQGLLDLLDIPYQGAGVLGSAAAMNKLLSKQLYERAGIPTPAYIPLHGNQQMPEADTLTLPVVVKPACAGSSVGMTLVRHSHELEDAIRKGFEHDDTLIIENYIPGLELTCGVLGNDAVTPLPVIEIIPGHGHDFFDYTAKYVAGETEEICPARLSPEITRRVQDLAVQAHRALFLTGYSRTDMILRDNEIFVLETNTIPGMTATSLFPRAARAAGYSFAQLLDRLILLGIENHESKHRRRHP